MPPGGSHPVIRFERLPVTDGPLLRFEKNRNAMLSDVVERTVHDFIGGSNIDLLIGEALYSERFRMKRVKPGFFMRNRRKLDEQLWGYVQGLIRNTGEIDRKALLDRILWHYAGEVGGHFNPRIYRFACSAVPWGFSWLLNAASVRRFLPWGMTQSLQSRLNIVGEVPLLQKLAGHGTILLVPTHQSNIDSVLIGYVIYLMSLPPFAYGAGLNLFSNPALSFFMSNLGAYTVDRQKTNALYKQFLKNYSTKILMDGIHSVFFPGGGRSRSGAIESRIKLGLLGTGIEAQTENLIKDKEKARVFIVPMVTSYHFVLEASSLIEDHLAEAGKHRYIITDDESWQPRKVLSFFWKLFSSQSSITVRIGKPLDVFGNFVDEEGRSQGPNGTVVDPVHWLTTCGELRKESQRDQEYTRILAAKLVQRFYRENTVLSSHLVAFSFFEALRKKYPDLDLYRFLRLSLEQRSLPYAEFLKSAGQYYDQVSVLVDRGELYLSEDLRRLAKLSTDTWVQDGIRQLGCLHEARVIRVADGTLWTEDMNLLYYYRNRLSGYGLSFHAGRGWTRKGPGQNDELGFLA
ncbi:MAG: 1-acyl-sn-glycerol-3-phosphate acyltransferase [Bdellovibrionota bacterium]